MRKKILAYIRVNQAEYKSGKQLEQMQTYLNNNGIEADDLIIEQVPGNYPFKSRVKLHYALNLLNVNDILIILRLMDLGYQTCDVMEVLTMIKDRDIKLFVVDTDLFDNWLLMQNHFIYQAAMSLLLKLLNKIAYLEKKQKSLDTSVGMEKAAREGRQVGHPRCIVPELFIKQYKNYKTGVYGGMCLKDFCRLAGVSKSCYYKYEKLLKLEGKLKEDIECSLDNLE